MKHIMTKNNKGQYHGYQEWYLYISGKPYCRGYHKNNRPYTYVEWHNHNKTIFYIK